jgi:hypothetical protein
MRRFKYFLLTTIAILFITTNINALTSTPRENLAIAKQMECIIPLPMEIAYLYSNANKAELHNLNASLSQSPDTISKNLTLLYTICFALVLFNLAAQIKIIFQMIHLFFLFQKEDEYARFNFPK